MEMVAVALIAFIVIFIVRSTLLVPLAGVRP
jgi:hypothetical protein